VYDQPITAYLFFAPPEHRLSQATDLILDFPGGGFVAMTPEHHEDRLRMWAEQSGRPVLAIDYSKAPECESAVLYCRKRSILTLNLTDPYPYAIDEGFDTYRVIAESVGKVIGMSGQKLNIIISGDSA
jgi:acetyl esterase/lipase